LIIFRRKRWPIRKQAEVLGMAGTVQDSVWALNDSAGNPSRQETSWSVKKGPGSILERMSGWGRIIPSSPELRGSLNLKKKEEIKNR
jgi:hypothetical protein